MSAKITHNKIYLVFSDNRGEDFPLGWGLGIKEKNTTKQQENVDLRKEKMMTWAFGTNYSGQPERDRYRIRNGLYFYRETHWWYYESKEIDEDCWQTKSWRSGTASAWQEPSYKSYRIDEPTTFRRAHQPKVVNNIPLEGFRVDKTVSRYSTQNKLWRINDPRGFQLEISTDNMMKILLNGEVKNGLFVGKYFWDFGKNGIGKAKLVEYEETLDKSNELV